MRTRTTFAAIVFTLCCLAAHAVDYRQYGNVKADNFKLPTGAEVNDISNDTTMADDSATALVTEHATKTYVDNAVSGFGDVSGPGSSTDSAVALWNGTGGDTLKDSAVTLPSGALVGTTDAQTLSAKTIDADSNIITNIGAAEIKADIITGLTTASSINAAQDMVSIYSLGEGGIRKALLEDIASTGDVVGPASATENNFAAFDGATGKLIKDSGCAAPSGAIVGTTDSQTLTNKTLDADSNTVSNIGAAEVKTELITGQAADATPDGAADYVFAYNASETAFSKILLNNLPNAAGGETNTMSNVGVGGVDVFKQKTGVDFELNTINAGSSKITVTADTGNNEVDIDVNVTGDVVGTSDTQTLTNKTLDADSNTVSNIGAAEVKADLITGQSEDTTPDEDNDYVLVHDASAAELKKVKLTNLPSSGSGGGAQDLAGLSRSMGAADGEFNFSADYAYVGTQLGTSLDLTLDADNSNGALGLDTGSWATSTVYNIWLLYGTSGYTLVASTSSTFAGVTKPSGYTTAGRCVGGVITDSSTATDFVPAKWSGETCYFPSGVANAGSARSEITVRTSGAYTANDIVTMSLSGLVPVTAEEIKVAFQISASTANVTMRVSLTNSTSADCYEQFNPGYANGSYPRARVDLAPQTWYTWTTVNLATLHIYFTGYTEKI